MFPEMISASCERVLRAEKRVGARCEKAPMGILGHLSLRQGSYFISLRMPQSSLMPSLAPLLMCVMSR